MEEKIPIREIPALHLRRVRDWHAPGNPFIDLERIGFLHVHKCGGTSFYSFLCSFFSEEEIIPVDVHTTLLQDLPEDYASKFRLITGWALDPGYLGSFPDVGLVTMMRDPVNRVPSEYRYHSSGKGLVVDRLEVSDAMRSYSAAARHVDFEEWLDRPASDPNAYVRNRFVKRLSYHPPGTENPDRHELREYLDRAKELLERGFVFVGITERYAESKDLFCRTFGLPPHFASHEESLNATAGGEDPGLSPSLEERIREENWADCELYDFARNLFRERLEISEGWNRHPGLDPGSPGPPSSEALDTRNLRGSGLYREEYRADGRRHRWTGGPDTTRIDFSAEFPRGGLVQVVIRAAFFLDEGFADQLAVRLDGADPESLAMDREQAGGIEIRAVFPSRGNRSEGLHSLEIDCPSRVPPPNPSGFSDDRPLGMAIERIELLVP